MPKVRNKLILGITGGIATGKTSVLRVLSKLRIPTVSADILAHKAILKGKPAYGVILRRFGRDILGSDGQIRRSDLGKIVFRNPRERRWLERLLHPVVLQELKRFVSQHRGMMALDIPLLFEAHYARFVDVIIVVSCPLETQLERLMSRNGMKRSEALRRVRSQMPMREKIRRADIVLNNSGTKGQLKDQIRKNILTLK